MGYERRVCTGGMELEVKRDINGALNAGGADEDGSADAAVGVRVARLLSLGGDSVSRRGEQGQGDGGSKELHL